MKLGLAIALMSVCTMALAYHIKSNVLKVDLLPNHNTPLLHDWLYNK
jgi:hypothetical protein